MKKKICKLVRCVQKVLKPRQTRVKISRSQIERTRTSENGTRKKLNDCASSEEVTITKDKFAVAIFTSSSGSQGTYRLQAITNATISSFNISCTPANYFETFEQQEEQIFIKC